VVTALPLEARKRAFELLRRALPILRSGLRNLLGDDGYRHYGR
jgi:hypothetical protein